MLKVFFYNFFPENHMVLHFNPVHLGFPFWCWEGLGAGGEGDDRGWDGWMALLTRWTLSLGGLRELVMDREAWRAAIHGVTKSRTRLSDWTELNFPWSVRLSLRLASLPHGCPIALAPMVDQVIVPPRNCFYIFVISQLGIFVWVYLWVFCSIPSISVSMPAPISQSQLL